MRAKTTAKPTKKPAPPKPPKPPQKRASAAPPPPKPVSLEERTALLEKRLLDTGVEFQTYYRDNLDMSWIYHDSALEGVVYTPQELRTAIDPASAVVSDASMQPVCEEIRRHREALDYVRDLATKRRQPITLDTVKKIYVMLHPEEGDIKIVKYRKDIPQHRLYFHEYAAPDKISHKVRQIVDWINDPETKRTRSPVRLAARAHYDLLRVFPFPHDSGKVARLLMNLLLLRSGFPPAIIHSTERQRYYEALKGSSATMVQIVQEAIDNNLASIEKMLDARDANREEEQRANAARGGG
jgi:Fic family protein